MSIIEIYHALRQITITKARILEQVETNKDRSMRALQRALLDYNSLEMQKPTQAVGPDAAQQDLLDQMYIRLEMLRKQEQELKEAKRRKMEHRMQVLDQRKQLQIKLEGLKYESEVQIRSMHREKEPGQQDNTRQEMLEANLKLIGLQKEVSLKLGEIEDANKQILEETELVELNFQQYLKLQGAIEALKTRIAQRKKQLEKQEFQQERMDIENQKLKKQLIKLADVENCRGIEAKIKQQTAVYQKLREIAEKSTQNKASLLSKLSKAKQLVAQAQ